MVPFDSGVEILLPRAGLAGRGANYTSQFGEDGLIKAALKEFGAVNKWCFEVGAHDGFFFSNTALLREYGWKAVLIEGDAEQYVKLAKIASPTVFTIPKRITERSLDQILEACGAPADIDLGVIDIDGQDYWAWWGMRRFRPRLMLVEFSYATERDVESFPECGGTGQANYKAILRLGAEKEYTALAKTHCNILFCRSEIMA